MNVDVVELQRQRIVYLEKQIKEQAEEICRLIGQNNNLCHVLSYLTDEEFRKYAFKLKYNELITGFLENESQGDVLL